MQRPRFCLCRFAAVQPPDAAIYFLHERFLDHEHLLIPDAQADGIAPETVAGEQTPCRAEAQHVPIASAGVDEPVCCKAPEIRGNLQADGMQRAIGQIVTLEGIAVAVCPENGTFHASEQPRQKTVFAQVAPVGDTQFLVQQHPAALPALVPAEYGIPPQLVHPPDVLEHIMLQFNRADRQSGLAGDQADLRLARPHGLPA